MGKILEWLKGKRTYILAGGGIIAAWFGVYSGAVTFEHAIELTLGALGISSLRAGVKNDIKNS